MSHGLKTWNWNNWFVYKMKGVKYYLFLFTNLYNRQFSLYYITEQTTLIKYSQI